ncbi:MAG: hypothetical protein VX741_04875 [Pseudomonadota bacterium]|nr:hypothetical protein [Pseudomonadota bacterium]
MSRRDLVGLQPRPQRARELQMGVADQETSAVAGFGGIVRP